jgi:site-specific DNA recombinase
MKKAIIWARVSTQEQAREGYSIDNQIERLTECCQKHNLTIFETFKVQESSTKGEKKEFNRMINLVKHQKDKVVVLATKIDRLNRSMADLSKLEELVRMENVELYFLENGSFDSNANSMQKMTLRMITIIANAYNDTLSDYGKSTYEYKIKNGECPGIAPVGYLNARDPITGKNTVILDEVRHPIIKKMFEMYSLGSYSLGDLEKFAQQYNITNTFYAGSTKTLSKNVISNLLKNSFYYGEIYSKKFKTYHPHKYPPLITKELFDECQRVNSSRCKENNRDKAVQTAKEGKDFVFRSLITCASSGRTATTDEKLDDRGYINNYLIVRNPEDIKKKVYVREKDVLAEVSNVFAKIKFPNEMLEIITDNLKKTHDFEQEHYQIKLSDIESRIKSEEQKQNRLLDALLNGSITQPIFANKKSEIEQNIANLERERAMYKSADKNFKNAVITAFQLASRLHDIFLVSKNCEKREIINFVFSKLELTGKTLGYSLRCPFDLMLENAGCDTWLPGLGSNQRPIG